MIIQLRPTVRTVLQPWMFMVINMACFWRANVSKCRINSIVLPVIMYMLMKQTVLKYFLKDVSPAIQKRNIQRFKYLQTEN